MLSLPELIARQPGATAPPGHEAWPPATGVTFHSGRVSPGDAFFALPGTQGHGIEFADRALAAGASFVVSDLSHPRGLAVRDPAGLLYDLGADARTLIRGTVVGVSGSIGKTTTKDMLAALLDARSSPGNMNTTLALACILVAAALHEADRTLVLELGIDRPGEMRGLVALTRPDVGVLTSIARSHAEYLGDLASIAAEKRPLLEASRLRFASDMTLPWLEPLPAGTVVYGLSENVAERGVLAAAADGGETLRWAGRDWRLPLPGRAGATNLTGALAVARALGVDADTAAARLADATVSPGRLQLLRIGQRLVIDDTYNSNPTSARAALEVLKKQPGPRAAVLGDMRELGAEAAGLHRELGSETRDLDMVMAVGNHAGDIRQGNPAALAVPDLDAAMALLGELPTHGTLLVKASRSLGFERLVTHLQELEDQACPS